MFEYKVFSWRFDLSDSEDLEQKLNEYGKEGWRVIKIIPNLKSSGSILYTTFILEKV